MKMFLLDAPYEIRRTDGRTNDGTLRLTRSWNGPVCAATLVNGGAEPAQVKEIALWRARMPFAPDTRVYGEGYNMLSQYAGTVAAPEDIGYFTDRGHYRLPTADGLFTVYNLLLCMPDGADAALVGFASCRRYAGEIRFSKDVLEIVLDFENLSVAPGESVPLEDVYADSGASADALLRVFGAEIARNHPKPSTDATPTGWCSWYGYGPRISRDIIEENLRAIRSMGLALRFIQIDDGYSKTEGDWLEESGAFPGGMRALCDAIRREGFEPAIWVGPFLCEGDADVFQAHPDWFVADDEGKPLPSDRVTFGGWRRGPWYMLDGTHPGARGYLRHVFGTMRREWGVRYFKLDGNMWGAFPFGRRRDPNATRVDAYRAGMRAIREAAGDDAILLGCNAPMWPSLGTVNAMRVSNDMDRCFEQIAQVARETLLRAWQNESLWIVDPDCVTLENLEPKDNVSDDAYLFHITAAFASGGMAMSGDRAPSMRLETAERLRKLMQLIGEAARFDDRTFSVGRTRLDGALYVSVLNWTDAARDFSIPLGRRYAVTELWTDQCVSDATETLLLTGFPPRAGRVYVCREAKE